MENAIYLSIYLRRSFNKFPDIFRLGTLLIVHMLCFDLLTRPKMPFKVMHRKEVTHSNAV